MLHCVFISVTVQLFLQVRVASGSGDQSPLQELSKVGMTNGSLARGGEVVLHDCNSSAGCCLCKHGCWSRGKHSCVDCTATPQGSSICLSNKGRNLRESSAAAPSCTLKTATRQVT